jgi:hypothetical protein
MEDNKSFAELQAQKVACIDWNDRMKLLKLIEYARNASPGYGITAILENFMDENQDWQHTAIISVKYRETPSYNFTIDK